jgi:hypothetical protein
MVLTDTPSMAAASLEPTNASFDDKISSARDLGLATDCSCHSLFGRFQGQARSDHLRVILPPFGRIALPLDVAVIWDFPLAGCARRHPPYQQPIRRRHPFQVCDAVHASTKIKHKR